MVDNYVKPKPERHAAVVNLGYALVVLVVIGVLLLIADTKDWIIALCFCAFSYVLWYARHVYFGQNPPSAQLLDLDELTKFRKDMNGEWTAELDPKQPEFPPRSHPMIYFPSFGEKEIPTATVCVEGESYKADCGGRSVARNLQIFQSDDKRMWFDEYGLEIFELDLPKKLKLMDHLGFVITLTRINTENKPVEAKSNKLKDEKAIPVYPEESEMKDVDLKSDGDDKLLTTNERSDNAV